MQNYRNVSEIKWRETFTIIIKIIVKVSTQLISDSGSESWREWDAIKQYLKRKELRFFFLEKNL